MEFTKKCICPKCKNKVVLKSYDNKLFYCEECGGYCSFDEIIDDEDLKAPTPASGKAPINMREEDALMKEKKAIQENDNDKENLLDAIRDLVDEKEEEKDEVPVPELKELTPTEEVEEEKEEIEEEEEENEPAISFEFGPSIAIKDNTTSFYEIHTTYEDCDPYVDDDILVVCDGCGGAGSSPHLLTKEKFGSYEKIKAIVLPEDENDCLKPQMDIMYKPILDAFKDSDTQTRTSAFLASRLVLPRYIYAFKKYKDSGLPLEEKLLKYKQFILKGMNREIKELDLTLDAAHRRNPLLSTTFVSVIFNGDPDNDEKVDIDVIWAGDSRAYVLYPDGLRKLVIDDEDTGGSLTNLFCIKPGREVVINRRHYSLDKPCIVLTCSDGVFDHLPDYFTLEAAITQFLVQSDSLDECATKLKELYNHVKGDDTTMALRSFGFKNYDELKEAYDPLFKRDMELYELKNEYYPYIEMREDPSVMGDALNFLTQRLEEEDILLEACTKIAQELEKGNLDDPYTKELARFYVEFLKEREEKKDELKEAKLDSIKNIISFLKEEDHALEQNYAVLFDSGKLDDEQKEKLANIIKGVTNYHCYLEAKTNYEKLDKSVRENFLSEAWKAAESRFKRIKDFFDLDESLISEEAKEAFIEDGIENGLVGKAAEFVTAVFKGDTSFVETANDRIRRLKEAKKEYEECLENKYDELSSTLKDEIKEFFDGDEEYLISLFDALSLNASSIASFTLIYRSIDASILEDDALALRIFNAYKVPGGAKKLVDIRLSYLEGATIIDDEFNPTFLKKALMYSAAGKPTGKALEFLEAYEKVNAVEEELLQEGETDHVS